MTGSENPSNFSKAIPSPQNSNLGRKLAGAFLAFGDDDATVKNLGEHLLQHPRQIPLQR